MITNDYTQKLTSLQTDKLLTERFVEHLLHYNPTSSLLTSYKSSLKCNSKVILTDGYTVGCDYCRQRWCLSCNKLRRKELRINYLKELMIFEDPCLVTLTVPTVKPYQLEPSIQTMERVWEEIRSCRENRKRKIKGIKKIECKLSGSKLHCHYHLIINGVDNARWLKEQWVERHLGVNSSAQECRKIPKEDLERTLSYIWKDSIDININEIMDGDYYQAADVMFSVLRNRRTFQPFGKVKKAKKLLSQILNSSNIHIIGNADWNGAAYDLNIKNQVYLN